MKTPRVALSTSGMRPIGFVGDDSHAIAVAIKGHIRSLSMNRKGDCLLTVVDDRIFATSTLSSFAARCPPQHIVGVYTKTAAAQEIADDLRDFISSVRKAA